MDLTPWVGIIGAAVGGSIGLLGQRMNIKEQRRRDLRERVTDFLREADLLNSLSARQLNAKRHNNHTHAQKLQEEMRTAMDTIDHRKQYLDLTAPWLVRFWVGQVHEAAMTMCAHTIAFGDDELERTVEGTYAEESLNFSKARTGLVAHLRPDIDDKPWWLRKPIFNILQFIVRPRARIRKAKLEELG